VFLGRGMGAVVGVVLAWSDLFANTPEAWKHQQYGLSAPHLASGALGVCVAVVSMIETDGAVLQDARFLARVESLREAGRWQELLTWRAV
jgi:hypothetical protein